MSLVKRTFLISIVFYMCIVMPLLGFPQRQHDDFMVQVLFGNPMLPIRESPQMKALKSASYLTLDQYNGAGAKQLSILKQSKVKNLPASINKIDFTSNHTHRSFTHRGWDHVYVIDKANWNLRKNILISTTNNIFNFKQKDQQLSNSFSALIYYIHVLGDHISANSIEKSELKMDFAGRTDKNDIANELLKHLPIIFKSQATSRTLSSLLYEIRNLNWKVSDLTNRLGGSINFTDEDVKTYTGYASELMDILTRYIPGLLKNESFFNKIFSRT